MKFWLQNFIYNLDVILCFDANADDRYEMKMDEKKYCEQSKKDGKNLFVHESNIKMNESTQQEEYEIWMLIVMKRVQD